MRLIIKGGELEVEIKEGVLERTRRMLRGDDLEKDKIRSVTWQDVNTLNPAHRMPI